VPNQLVEGFFAQARVRGGTRSAVESGALGQAGGFDAGTAKRHNVGGPALARLPVGGLRRACTGLGRPQKRRAGHQNAGTRQSARDELPAVAVRSGMACATGLCVLGRIALIRHTHYSFLLTSSLDIPCSMFDIQLKAGLRIMNIQ
jgi:hypothetical protein